VQTGITLGKNYGFVELEKRSYLRVANVQDGYLDLKDITTINIPTSEARASELQPGDVLMTEGGDIDKLGRGYIWRGEIPGCLHQNHIFAVRADHNVLLPEFLALLLTSRHGRSYFQLTAKQTTNLASTNSTTLKAFPIFIPSIEEQQRLLDYIAQESTSLDIVISKYLREIDLIREYRTRLIADVVTGKLDVRHIELSPLDETGGLELPDEGDEEGEVLADDEAEDLEDPKGLKDL
jgi:type I restriction enzyme S subunit